MPVTQDDSGLVIKVTGAGPQTIYTGQIFVEYIRWTGATTAGHEAIIEDTPGNEVILMEADGANFTDLVPIFHIIRGLYLNTLDSGTLMIYYR